MIKAIIFDCWSTLVKKDAPFPSSIPKWLNWENEYEIEKIVGRIFMLEPIKDLKNQVKEFLKELGANDDKKLADGIIDILTDKYVNYNKYYDGTSEVLNMLGKDYKIGLITNTTDIAFEPLRKKYNFDDIFDEIITSYEAGLIKPDPKIFQLALERLGVNKEEALMVGDSLKDDIEAAQNCGIKALMLDNKGKHPEYSPRITSIKQIFDYLKNL